MMKKVISLCLFAPVRGHSTGLDREDNLLWYSRYLPLVIIGYRALFPDFEVWLHSNLPLESVKDGGVTKWSAENSVIKYIHVKRDDPMCLAMLWRLMPLFDDSVEYVFCRDVDAMPRVKDRKAVEAFIASKYVVHAILDRPAHAGLMGGMGGFFASKIREMLPEKSWLEYASKPLDWAKHGADQVFLDHHLWRPLVGRKLMHDFIVRPSTANPTRVFKDVNAIELGDVPEALQVELNNFKGYIGTPINQDGEYCVADALQILRKYGYYINETTDKGFNASRNLFHN